MTSQASNMDLPPFGQAISCATYRRLFAAIGASCLRLTFDIPDLRAPAPKKDKE